MTNTDSLKIFISYSWTDDEHYEWVADLGERLMSDGIEVVLDQWSLQDGHDLNVFMERMVNDPSITRVVIVSNSHYAQKADGRQGGVGTETQIISKEVYDSVDQTKFVPLVREKDANGEAYLPTYLRSRKYIDFSDVNFEADAYDQLIRNIYERPKRRKPPLGKPPAYLFDDSPISVTSAQKAKRFRETIASGKGKPSVFFEDFCDEFLANLEELRMTYSRDLKDSWCEQLKENIDTARVHRNVYIDVVRTGAMHLSSEEFFPPLTRMLERILPLTERPAFTQAYHEESEDNYKFLCYELFLSTVAILLNSNKFEDVRKLIEHRYVVPRTFGGRELETRQFTEFNAYARSLEDFCGQQNDRRRLSVTADLLHDRADHPEVSFSNLLQSDILLCLASGGYGWFPRTIVYSRRSGKLEMFLRAETTDGFKPLSVILNIRSPRELLSLIRSDEMQEVWRVSSHLHAHFALEAMNVNELTRIWGDQNPS